MQGSHNFHHLLRSFLRSCSLVFCRFLLRGRLQLLFSRKHDAVLEQRQVVRIERHVAAILRLKAVKQQFLCVAHLLVRALRLRALYGVRTQMQVRLLVVRIAAHVAVTSEAAGKAPVLARSERQRRHFNQAAGDEEGREVQ